MLTTGFGILSASLSIPTFILSVPSKRKIVSHTLRTVIFLFITLRNLRGSGNSGFFLNNFLLIQSIISLILQ